MVGYSYYDSSNEPRDFFYSKAMGMIDLNSLLPANSGWVLKDAAAINNSGQIVGTAEDSMGNDNAFVLSGAAAKVARNVVTGGLFYTLTDWKGLANELDQSLPQGTDLQGEVSSYVTQWDSSSGWIGALSRWSLGSIGVPARLSLDVRKSFMVSAASDAEQAAETAYSDLTNPQNNYLGAPSDGQLIQLIGHSRGAAVNARLSQILVDNGYAVDQYISLDGYSTDWPFPSDMLGDISIVGNATADRKVNYEVQEGILPALIGMAGEVHRHLYFRRSQVAARRGHRLAGAEPVGLRELDDPRSEPGRRSFFKSPQYCRPFTRTLVTPIY